MLMNAPIWQNLVLLDYEFHPVALYATHRKFSPDSEYTYQGQAALLQLQFQQPFN